MNKKNQKYDIIGSYNPKTGEIDREATAQGFVYKNPNAFYSKSKEVCYIAELSDDLHTYADFLEIAKGNAEIAGYLFDRVDWQHPQTLMDEVEMYDEDED